MKDAKGHGSNPRGTHAASIEKLGTSPLGVMYHGTNKDFDQFELGHGAPGSQNGVWLSQDQGTAREYAGISARYGGAPVIYSATVTGNMASKAQWDALEGSLPGTRYTFERDKQIITKLKSQGYDGLRSGNAVYVFNPSQIKIIKKERL